MKKFVCQVCGYVYEGEAAPAQCPQCKAPASKFTEMKGEMTWAAEHVVGARRNCFVKFNIVQFCQRFIFHSVESFI